MNTFIVHAHPEPRSFNAALRDTAQAVLAARGPVVVSDLYTMGFQPVVGRGDFVGEHDASRFNVSLEQRHALAHGTLAPDVAAELDKLMAADLLILQFPMWWFGLPAILKGWIDRVFISGAVYGRSAVFENGKLRGKRAMVCVTTGAPEQAFGNGSLNGNLLDLLAPLHRGVLGFTGMMVLPPFACFHVPYAGNAGRQAMLDAYRQRLEQLDRLTPLAMPRVDQHPESGFGGDRPAAT